MSLTKIGALALALSSGTPLETPQSITGDSTRRRIELALNVNSGKELQELLGDMSGIDAKKIQAAQQHFQEALKRLEGNRHFRNYIVNKNLLFSLMVKESLLDNTRVSSSGAEGYFQLKGQAIKDAQEFIEKTLKIRTKTYSPKDPIENCILGIVYYLATSERVETLSEEVDIDDNQTDTLTLVAYNLGIGNTGKLVTIYSEETKNISFQWDDFVAWLVKKAGLKGVSTMKKEDIYKVEYRDWFDGVDLSKDTTEIKFSSTLTIPKAKIQEFVNYVEKINGILLKPTPVTSSQALPYAPNPSISRPPLIPNVGIPEIAGYTVQGEKLVAKIKPGEKAEDFLKRFGLKGPLALGVFQDINAQHFESRSVLPQEVPIKEGIDYQIPIFVVSVQSGDTWSSLLTKKSIPLKHLDKIIAYNKIFDPKISKDSPLALGSKIFVPFWRTGFYTDGATDELPQEVKPILKPAPQSTVKPKPQVEVVGGKFNFRNWIDSIEKVSDKLKGKVFILDPGHGGPDLGSIPIARDQLGNPISDPNSAVKVIDEKQGKTNRVAPGSGSGYLHVYESLVTLDVSYRLAKLIKENGGTVHITRYNQTTGIINQSNSTTPRTGDDIFSDTGSPWEYTRANQNFRLKRGVEIGNSIQTSTNTNSDNVFFLSIHADSDPRGPVDNPIRFIYYRGSSGTSEVGSQLAANLAGSVNFRGKQAVTGPQGLYIINPRYNQVKNSVLVELANMNNAAAAFLLRQANGRQRFADALFEGILKSSTTVVSRQ